MPDIIQPSDCCNPCDSPTTVQIPGQTGSTGAAGTNGANGVSAFSITVADFIMPAIGGNVVVTVSNSTWMAPTQVVYVQNAGYMEVVTKGSNTTVTLENLGYTGNAAPTTNIPALNLVSPAGLKGLDGSPGTTDIDDISPTTTKGDLLVDNGASSPNSSLVRLAVGSNGQNFEADSTQATGVKWVTRYLDGSGTLDFPSVTANGGTQDLTITVTGAAVNDPVSLGPPTTLNAGLIPYGFVSAVNTVTVRVTNATAGNLDPASATWKVRVHK